jgi:hypothetical protein
MGFEITAHATVGPTGHIELDLPELAEGQEVRLVVATEPKRRGLFGCMRGEPLSMSDDFDDPLPEFAEYQ